MAAGPTLQWSMLLLEDFIAELAGCPRNSPPRMTERCSMISWAAGADEMAAADLLASAKAPRVFLDPGIRRDRRLYLRIVRRLLAYGVLSLGLRHGCDVGPRTKIGVTVAGCGRLPRQY